MHEDAATEFEHRMGDCPRAVSLLVLFWGLGLLVACGDDAPSLASLPDPPRIAHTAVVEEGGPIFRSIIVELDRPAGLLVEYWTNDTPHLRLREEASREQHNLFIPRLRADRVYRYEAWALGEFGVSDRPQVGTFSTGSLPEGLREIEVVTHGTPTFPLTMMEAITPMRPYYPFVVDREGHIVWYRRAGRRSAGFTRLADGTFVFNTRDALEVVTLRNEVVARLDAAEAGARSGITPFSIHHDVIRTPDNTVLMLVQDTVLLNDTIWTGDAIWEWDPASESLEKKWAAKDFFDPDRDRGPRSRPGDWLHANSLHLGPRGNVIVSLFWLHEVFSIAPDFQSLEWRLGGPKSSFTVKSNAMEAGQHTAAEVHPNRILMFDNGWNRSTGLYSRALEMEIDGEADMARIAWEFRPSPDIYAPVISSARRLENGNTLVGFGMTEGSFGGATGPISVFEVTPDKRVLWRLDVVRGLELIYRTTHLSTLGGEVEVEGPSNQSRR